VCFSEFFCPASGVFLLHTGNIKACSNTGITVIYNTCVRAVMVKKRKKTLRAILSVNTRKVDSTQALDRKYHLKERFSALVRYF